MLIFNNDFVFLVIWSKSAVVAFIQCSFGASSSEARVIQVYTIYINLNEREREFFPKSKNLVLTGAFTTDGDAAQILIKSLGVQGDDNEANYRSGRQSRRFWLNPRYIFFFENFSRPNSKQT